MKQPNPAISPHSDTPNKTAASLLPDAGWSAQIGIDTNTEKSRKAIRQGKDALSHQNSIMQTDSDFFILLEQLPFSSIVCNTDNVVIAANQRFYELYEKNSQTCIGKPVQEVILPVHTDSQLPELSRFIALNCHMLEDEYAITVSHKLQKHVLLKSTLISNAGGTPEKILMQLVDITKKKEAEQLLQERSAELERFVYSTSHDLRAPLRSILGLIYIMQQETNPDVLKTYLDMIRSSVNRMDNFIKEMVDLSRNSRQPVNKEEINLQDCISQIIDSLKYIQGAEKIDFSIDIKQDKPFVSDISRIQVILTNLISNAIAYHRLHQQKPFIQVLATVKDKYCVLQVIDNGKGIQREHQAKIFDMFYRASDDSKGSGLGLYIVKEAVQKLNGEIRIQSKWEEGSIFTVKLFNHYD